MTILDNETRVYFDCFTFHRELELLELRLTYLWGVVDHFIIVEGSTTYSGLANPSKFSEIRERFSWALNKITFVRAELDAMPPSAWVNEALQRSAIEQGFNNRDDSCLFSISCVDEIPKKDFIVSIKESGLDTPFLLELQNHYYSLNGQVIGGGSKFLCPVVAPASVLLKKTAHAVWVNRFDYPVASNAGWHFSFLGSVCDNVQKIRSYSHQEYNQESILNEFKMSYRRMLGLDVLARNNKTYVKYVPLDFGYPNTIIEEYPKYQHLVGPVSAESGYRHSLIPDQLGKLLPEVLMCFCKGDLPLPHFICGDQIALCVFDDDQSQQEIIKKLNYEFIFSIVVEDYQEALKLAEFAANLPLARGFILNMESLDSSSTSMIIGQITRTLRERFVSFLECAPYESALVAIESLSDSERNLLGSRIFLFDVDAHELAVDGNFLTEVLQRFVTISDLKVFTESFLSDSSSSADESQQSPLVEAMQPRVQLSKLSRLRGFLSRRRFFQLIYSKFLNLTHEESLQSFKRNIESRKKLIIYFSPLEWDFRYQRPQQLCTEIADDETAVLFISFSTIGCWQWRSENPLHKFRRKAKGVFEFTPWMQLDLHSQNISSVDAAVIIDWLVINFDEQLDKKRISVICAWPAWEDAARSCALRFGASLSIDVMDEIEGFSNIGKPVTDAEERLLVDANLVFCSSQRLLKKVGIYNRNVALIQNGCSPDDFSGNIIGVRRFNTKKSVTIGYFGAVAEWFDFDLLWKLATTNLTFRFLIIGDVTVDIPQRLSKCGNVDFIGELPYKKMVKTAKCFDVGLIPFRITPLIKATNPVKFFEYCALGIPTVSTYLPELKIYSDICFLANDESEFSSMLSEALKKSHQNETSAQLIKFSHNNSWRNRANVIKKAII